MIYFIGALIVYAIGFFAGKAIGTAQAKQGTANKPLFSIARKSFKQTESERQQQIIHDNIEAFGTTTPQKDVE